MLMCVSPRSCNEGDIIKDITTMVGHRKLVTITFADCKHASAFVSKGKVQCILNKKPVTDLVPVKDLLIKKSSSKQIPI